MRRDGLKNIRNIVSEILDSQFRGQPITVAELIKLHGKSFKDQLSEGSIYNALRTLRKAGILITSPLAGRKNNLSIDYVKARDNIALFEIGDKAAEINHLPEGPRNDLLRHIRWENDTLAHADTEMIYQMYEKYGNRSSEISESVIGWLCAKALSYVMKYMEMWPLFAMETLNANPGLYLRTQLKHLLQSETLRTALLVKIKTRDRMT